MEGACTDSRRGTRRDLCEASTDYVWRACELASGSGGPSVTARRRPPELMRDNRTFERTAGANRLVGGARKCMARKSALATVTSESAQATIRGKYAFEMRIATVGRPRAPSNVKLRPAAVFHAT